MDYSLRLSTLCTQMAKPVLILILMDYSLSIQAALWLVCTACLNPYSNGLLSEEVHGESSSYGTSS